MEGPIIPARPYVTAKPPLDVKRTCKAIQLPPWPDGEIPEYGDYGEPGAGRRTFEGKDHFSFACPGCGRMGAITCTKPKTPHSWEIVSGSLDDVTSLTLAPSIFCTGCCKWHGFLREGVFKSV